MSRHHLPVSLALCLCCATACTPAGGAASTAQLRVTPKLTPAQPPAATRAVALAVLAPGSLAKTGTTIVNEDPAGLIAAGGLNLIANTSVPLIAAGGLNLAPTVDAVGPRFALRAEGDAVKPVAKAVVTFHEFTPDGKALVPLAAQTDAEGKVTLKAVASDRPLEARAVFKVDGETYRLTSAIPAENLDGMTVVLDPINTIVAARIRAILKANGKTSPALVFRDLKNVWAAVDESGVAVDLTMLRSGATLEELDAFYQQLVDQMTDEAKKKVVTDYMKKIREST